MLSLIVTHPGSAHQDDFLSVCLLAARHGAPVARRQPTAADLADPTVCCVDAGGEHAPERMNFDHHQFPREQAPSCSVSLVLQHLGLYEDARRFCAWLEPAEWMDVRGPQRTAEWMGVGTEVLFRLNSPVEAALLRRFGGLEALAPGEPLYEAMRCVGEELLGYLSSARARVDFIGEHATIWRLEAGGEAFEALFVPRTDPVPDDPSGDTERYVRVSGLGGRVAALVYPDSRRPTGYGIARFDDHPKLDFCRVEGAPGVHFVHKSGFLCKTTATEPERLQALLVAAWG